MDKPFAPTGPTTTVTNTAVQVVTGQQAGQVYRIRNLSASAQYITWGPTSSVVSATPSGGSPAGNTLGIIASGVEKVTLSGANLWFIASSATGFEVTSGDGI